MLGEIIPPGSWQKWNIQRDIFNKFSSDQIEIQKQYLWGKRSSIRKIHETLILAHWFAQKILSNQL